jgi:hypothetical protein
LERISIRYVGIESWVCYEILCVFEVRHVGHGGGT